MTRTKIFSSIIALTLICANVYANTQAYEHADEQTSPENAISYKNQQGSVLKLVRQNNKDNIGLLTGTFTTAVGDCKKDIGVPLPVTGVYNGNAIALTVSFPNCKAVASMTGHFTKDNNDLNTSWYVAKQAADPVHGDWNSMIAGHDYFQKSE